MVMAPGPICPRCATQNNPGALMCARCGRLLGGRTCPHCGQEHTRAGAKFCEHCGGDVYAAVATPAAAGPRAHEVAAPPQHLSTVMEEPPLQPFAAGEEPAPEPPAVWEGPPPESHVAAEEPPPAVVRATLQERVQEPPAAVKTPVQEPPDVKGEPVPREQPAARDQTVSTVSKEKRAPKGYAAKRAQQNRQSRSPATVAALVVVLGVLLATAWTIYQRGQDRAVTRAAVPQQNTQGQTRPTTAASPSDATLSPARQAPPPPIGATMKVMTSPAGAQVELDGQPVGVTRLTLTGLKPGTHKIKISKAGFRSVTREFTVVTLETITLDLTLTPAPSQPDSRRRPPPPPPPPPP